MAGYSSFDLGNGDLSFPIPQGYLNSGAIITCFYYPPPPPPPPPTTYEYNGTDCNGSSVTIYTFSSPFSINSTAYSDANGTLTYSGYFIYSGNIYSYTGGNGTTITSVGHNVFECAGNVITIYTNNAIFNIGSTAYANQCLTTLFNGAIVSDGNTYKYSGGIASQSYAHVGTDCSGNSVTIYTDQSSFSSSTHAYSDTCLTSNFTGYFIYSGIAYYYSSGTSSRYSYAHVGTDCSGSSVTIYTNNTTFLYTDSANSDQCRTTNYTGYFIFSGTVYYYFNSSGSISSCPTPPPSPAPSYTNPNTLKADIHSSYATGSGAWQTYRANVTGLFVSNSGANRADYRDHLIREFNRKISILNQPTGLFIRPFDNGFRFTGVSIQ
jgi:hypothetical protein